MRLNSIEQKIQPHPRLRKLLRSQARKQLAWYAIILGAFGLVPVLFPIAFMLIFVYGIGIFLYAFVANYILHRAARRF
jgi:hypothetical protein